jgi:cobaltochelatase CobN
MQGLLQLLSALVLFLFLPAAGGAQDKVRLSYLFSDGNVPGTLAAFQSLLAERPDLRGRIELSLLVESTLADPSADQVRSSSVLVFDTMNEQMLAKWNAEHKTDLLAEVAKHGTILGVGEGLQPKESYAKYPVIFDQRAHDYWQHAGPQNQLALMKLALSRAGITGFNLPVPQVSLDFGYYYSDGKSGQVFPTWEAFDAWRSASGKRRPGTPRVAISFFKALYYSGDTLMLDALIAEVERQGAEAVPIFGYPGAVALERLLLDANSVPRADVVLGANFQFVDAQAPKVVEKVGIPVINLISLYGRSEKDWRESSTGLSTFEGTFTLAAPELAGTIAPTVVGTKEKIRDPGTGLNSVITSPIASRIAMAVSRALRYASIIITRRGKRISAQAISMWQRASPTSSASFRARAMTSGRMHLRLMKFWPLSPARRGISWATRQASWKNWWRKEAWNAFPSVHIRPGWTILRRHCAKKS